MSDLQNLIIVVGLGLIASHILYQGANPYFDDASYLKYANQMLNGSYGLTQSIYSYGYGFISLTASSLLFENSPTYPELLSYLGIILISYSLLSKLFNQQIALISTIMLELSAFMIVYSTRLLPDMIVGFLISTVIYYWITARDSKILIFISGVIAGSLIFIKISSLSIMILGILLYIIIFKENSKYLITGFILSLIMFQLVAMSYNTNLPSLISNYDKIQASLSTTNLLGNILFLGIIIGGYSLPARLFSQIFPLGLIFIFSFIGIYLYLRTNKTYSKESLFLTSFYIISLFLMLFGTESLSNWVYITNETRYMVYFGIPMVFLTAYMLDYIYKKYQSKILLYVFILALLISNIPQYIFFIMNPQYHFRF